MTNKTLVGFTIIFLGLVTIAQASKVSITTDGKNRYIKSNGIPDHTPGQFPNQGNPNRISAQSYSFNIPMLPSLTGITTSMRRYLFGVAINGVPFDPGTAEYWNNDRSSGWNYDALSGKINLGLDQHNAHVQPTGAYHYHGVPTGLLKGAGQHSPLIGYAADGFPIYAVYGYSDPDDGSSSVVEIKSSHVLKSGNRPSGPGGAHDGTFVQDFKYVSGAGNLDDCNGRVGVTPEYPNGTYHYFLTNDFPFVPRCFKGTPNASFTKQGGPPGAGMQGRGPSNGDRLNPSYHLRGGHKSPHRRPPPRRY